jgi:serine protease
MRPLTRTPPSAAVAGIVWAANPMCTNAEIRVALQKSAQDLPPAGRDAETGFGLVDAAAALNYLAKNKCKAYLLPKKLL